MFQIWRKFSHFFTFTDIWISCLSVDIFYIISCEVICTAILNERFYTCIKQDELFGSAFDFFKRMDSFFFSIKNSIFNDKGHLKLTFFFFCKIQTVE